MRWATEMAQRVKTLIAKPGDLSSIPMAKGENNPHRLSSDFHTNAWAHINKQTLHICKYTNKLRKCNIKEGMNDSVWAVTYY